MLYLYKIITTILYPFLIIFIFIRKIKKKEHPTRFKEKIFPSSFNINRDKRLKLIWFHASSIGELNSILPIIEDLNKKKKLEFLITTTTFSSGEMAKRLLERFKNIHHRYLPLDVNFLVSIFVDSWSPNALFLVDSEIWPNLISKVNKNKIPLALINARLTLKTFKRWNIFSNTAKKIFGFINLCLTANQETKEFLQKFNVNNIYYHGNIKLIKKIDLNKIHNPNKEILKNKKFWFAASTHRGEEILCLETHLFLKKTYKEILTIIAPRHIVRVNEVKNLCDKFKLTSQILDSGDAIQNNKEIIILSSFGVLNQFFKYTKSTFIGKSLVEKLKNEGGQNPIDAAKLNCKVYHGPFVYNFNEIYEILRKNNVSKKIENATELGNNLLTDLNNNSKKETDISSFIDKLGSKTFDNTMKYINKFLSNEIK